MNIFSRIVQFIDYKGISKSEFSRKIGLSNSYMTKMEDSKGNVGSQIIEKIVRLYPEINLKWLFTGEGDMVNQRNDLFDSHSPIDLPPGPCQQCELRERLLQVQDHRISELQSRLSELTTCHDPKSKAHCA